MFGQFGEGNDKGQVTDVKSISYDKYLQMLGLISLGIEKAKELDNLDHAAKNLIGEKPDSSSFCWELIHGDRTLDSTLHYLGITVEPPAVPEVTEDVAP